MYKYDEFTKEEFDYYNKKTSGKFTYMIELPNNTKFEVHNGNWNGKIIHKNEGVYIQTTLNDSLCVNGKHQFKIDEKCSLWIEIID